MLPAPAAQRLPNRRSRDGPQRPAAAALCAARSPRGMPPRPAGPGRPAPTPGRARPHHAAGENGPGRTVRSGGRCARPRLAGAPGRPAVRGAAAPRCHRPRERRSDVSRARAPSRARRDDPRPSLRRGARTGGGRAHALGCARGAGSGDDRHGRSQRDRRRCATSARREQPAAGGPSGRDSGGGCPRRARRSGDAAHLPSAIRSVPTAPDPLPRGDRLAGAHRRGGQVKIGGVEAAVRGADATVSPELPAVPANRTLPPAAAATAAPGRRRLCRSRGAARGRRGRRRCVGGQHLSPQGPSSSPGAAAAVPGRQSSRARVSAARRAGMGRSYARDDGRWGARMPGRHRPCES